MSLNVFEVFAKIGLDDSSLNKGLKGAGSAVAKIGKSLAKLGSIAVTAGTAMTTALVKSAVDSYAEYEQLVGGVDTLFKESSAKVQAYADEAYKTAGMSANQYMETVTSFSASLLQSLSGDTDKAADVANMALMDMSDNANKMGTAMESIQNAYQGFAKQNYTMLDNLKLGYGGTKQEMERLLDDAEKIAGVEYDISNLNDVYEAIHVIQEELGITGTTALEAADTISGSAGSLKAAWDNLVTGFANPDADFDSLIDQVVESAETLFNNVVPIIEKSISGIADFVTKIAPIISKRLPALASKILPNLISAASSLVSSLITQLPSLLEALAPPFIDGVLQVINALLQPDFISSLTNTIVQVVGMAAQALAQAIPQLIPTVVQAVITIVTTLLQPENINMLVDAGIQLQLGLQQGIIDALPLLIDAIPQIIEGLVQAIITNAPKVLIAGGELIIQLITGIISMIPQLYMLMPDIIEGVVTGLLEGIPDMVDAGAELISSFFEGLISDNPIVNAFTEWFEEAKQRLAEFADFVSEWAYRVGETIESGVRAVLGDDWVDMMEDFGGDIYDLTHPDEDEPSKNGAQLFGEGLSSFVDNLAQYKNAQGGTTSTESGTVNAQMVVDGEVFGRLVYDYNSRQSEKVGTTITER